jgi:hypothetical protein
MPSEFFLHIYWHYTPHSGFSPLLLHMSVAKSLLLGPLGWHCPDEATRSPHSDMIVRWISGAAEMALQRFRNGGSSSAKGFSGQTFKKKKKKKFGKKGWSMMVFEER